MKSKDMLGLGQCCETPGTNPRWWVSQLDPLPKTKLLRDTYFHGEGSAVTSCAPCSKVRRDLVPLTLGYPTPNVYEHKYTSCWLPRQTVQCVRPGPP